jgi:hypothetical protein
MKPVDGIVASFARTRSSPSRDQPAASGLAMESQAAPG